MKHSITSTVVVLVTVTLLGSIAATTLLQQQASAIIDDNKKEFNELTKDFQKDVLDAASVDPGRIPGLLEEYSRNVMMIFESPSPSP